MQDALIYERESSSIIKEALRDREVTLKVYARGDSMGPIIKEGNILIIKPTTSKKVRIGDIVVFDTSEKLCAHRLIRKYFRQDSLILLTKSDKSLVADIPFGDKKLIGKVSHIEKEAVILNLESILWTIINRILGLYHSLILSAINRLNTLKALLIKIDE